MVYIIVFIIMCYLDYKFDTYAGFKVMGTLFFGMFIFFGSHMYYADKTIPLEPTEETFFTSNFTQVKTGFNDKESNFRYSTKEGTKSFNSNWISEFKESSKENKITIYNYRMPKSANIWFFIFDGGSHAIVEFKKE